MSRAADIELIIDNFQAMADRMLYLADLKPSRWYYVVDPGTRHDVTISFCAFLFYIHHQH
jgi:hypothetical protein